MVHQQESDPFGNMTWKQVKDWYAISHIVKPLNGKYEYDMIIHFKLDTWL